jgi:hypothetical protein
LSSRRVICEDQRGSPGYRNRAFASTFCSEYPLGYQ